MYRLAFTLALVSLFTIAQAQPNAEHSRAYVMLGAGTQLGVEGGLSFALSPRSELRVGLLAGFTYDFLGRHYFVDDNDNPMGDYNATQWNIWAMVPVTLMGHFPVGERGQLGGGLGLLVGTRAFSWGDEVIDGIGYNIEAPGKAFAGGFAIGPRLIVPSYRVALGGGRTKLALEGVFNLPCQFANGFRAYPQFQARVGILF